MTGPKWTVILRAEIVNDYSSGNCIASLNHAPGITPGYAALALADMAAAACAKHPATKADRERFDAFLKEAGRK